MNRRNFINAALAMPAAPLALKAAESSPVKTTPHEPLIVGGVVLGYWEQILSRGNDHPEWAGPKSQFNSTVGIAIIHKDKAQTRTHWKPRFADSKEHPGWATPVWDQYAVHGRVLATLCGDGRLEIKPIDGTVTEKIE